MPDREGVVKRSALHRKSRLRRGTAKLERRTRLSPKRATERRSSRVRDEAYLAWLRLQPCAVREVMSPQWESDNSFRRAIATALLSCSGPTDPDHRRGADIGMSKKADDRDAWPCCRRHHGDRHDKAGVFKGMTRAQLNEFIRERIAEANAAYERHLAQAVPA